MGKRGKFILFVIAVALICLLTSCANRSVVDRRNVASSEKTRWATITRDSIIIRDSIIVKTERDTVFVERWRRQFVEKWRYDTISVAKVDTVYTEIINITERTPARVKLWLLVLPIIILILLYLLTITNRQR